ncbi:protein CLMP1 [Phragmites australis]|uniref:protein CLMP1 n=1 Tax=Phragmites australis TaxID=29695 RepID=UPI002D769280|nr:protein CLMP1 [Phragmites australis]
MGKSGAKKKKPAAAAASKSPPTSAEPKPTPTPSPSPSPAANGAAPHQVVDADVLLRRAHELKEEGNRLFQSRDYAGALRQYDLALRLAPRGHPDRAVFHSNRAACLLQLRPVDHEAVAQECSLALQAEPRFPRALLRRARALEVLGRHELALTDALALLALDPDHRDAIDLAHRLRSRVNASSATASSTPEPTSRPSPAALGASAVVTGLGPSLPARPFPKKPSLPPPPPQPAPAMSKSNPQPSPKLVPFSNSPTSSAKPSAADGSHKAALTLPVPSSLPATTAALIDRKVVTRWRPLKLVYDHDIRLGQVPAKCSFRMLREFVAKRFPSSKAVLIKYKDADGDLVTITSTEELRLAESFVDKVGHEVVENGKASDNKLPMLRLHIVEVSTEQEPSFPSEEEKLEEDEELLVKGEDTASAEVTECEVTKQDVENRVTEQSMETGEKDCGHAECKEAEVDDWLLQFAELFRNQVGIDADAHLDLHELGMELCSEALEETVTSNEAQALFEMAAAKFQEVAALALFNWGNVHMCAARKRIPLDESAPKEIMAAQLRTAYDWVRERYALAGHKYEEALKIKPDFYEGLLALGQQHFETAKLHWSFALADKVDLSTWDSSETFKLFDSSEQNMRAATEMWENVEEQRMVELKEPGAGEKDEVLRKRRKQHSGDGQPELTPEEAAEQAAVMRQQIHLFWGNMLFERSQVEFKLSVGDWKKNLDASVERFKLAGALESDISTVLKNHFSNAVSEFEEKKVMTSGTEISQTNDNIEDKCVVDI